MSGNRSIEIIPESSTTTARRPVRPDGGTDLGSPPVRAPRRWRKIVAGLVGVAVWVSVAVLWPPGVVPLVLLGALILAAFQTFGLSWPARRLWARDSVSFAQRRRGKVAVVLVLAGVVAAATVEASGTWIDGSWAVLLLAVSLAVGYAVLRRLLVTVAAACVVVLGVGAWLAPTLAHQRAGDRQLVSQLDALAGTGVLDGFRDLAVTEVDLSATPQVRNATIGTVSSTTPMEIGSITKAMTGLVIADSIRRGELSLTAPVSIYLPQLTGSAAGDATVGALVSHHAGYPEFGSAVLRQAFLNGPIGRGLLGDTLVQTLDQARDADLSTSGGYPYSTLGAAVAGQAAASAAGLTYPELMRTRLFAPLGMTKTSIPATSVQTLTGWSASGLPEQTWHLDGYAPAGAAVSTTHDLGLLATALLNGTAPGMAALDPRASADRTGTRVGMFWQVSHWNNGQTITWHNGQTSGHTAYLGLDRTNRKAVIVLSDVARADITDLGVRLLADTPAPTARDADLH
jgi:CubicO group peptidase (beta-lactamase class C family)